MASSAEVLDHIPGLAVELVRQLGRRAVQHDLYDETGSIVYHDVAGADTHEIREIVSALRTRPGSVLDLAAGSGRLTFPLLALGRAVTSLELSTGMIGILADRMADAPAPYQLRSVLVQGDMRTTDLGSHFDVVLLGTTTISLLDATGRQDLYRRVLGHLVPGGSFLVSTVHLSPDQAGSPEHRNEVVGTSGRRYFLFERYLPGSGSRTVTVVPDDDDADEIAVCTTTIGVLEPAQLEAELLEAGFDIADRIALPGLSAHHHGTLFAATPAGRP